MFYIQQILQTLVIYIIFLAMLITLPVLAGSRKLQEIITGKPEDNQDSTFEEYVQKHKYTHIRKSAFRL